jgi:glycosyltransferase involved in cell wall biosynthesis
MARLERVTFVQGGFAGVGGIETFAADLLLSLSARKVQTELICWDAVGSKRNRMLDELSRSSARIWQTGWRWGCQWGWPDSMMVLQHWKRLAQAELLVFGKLLHHGALNRLLSLRKRMILVTPYRPAEMWRRNPPSSSVLNAFESIIVQASCFEEDLRTFGYRGRIVMLPYLPPAASEPTLWPRSRVLQIGFLGRLVPDKNLNYLIAAFSLLRSMGVEARLHLYGDGPERQALERQAQEIGPADLIQFHRNRSRDQIKSAIDRCHIFAFSSKTEGQCMAALEILSRGRPIVGTPVGALPELLQGSLGSIVPLNNPEVFASALKSVGAQALEGAISPADVQQAYLRRFDRLQVIEEYMRVFGCFEKSEREARIA